MKTFILLISILFFSLLIISCDDHPRSTIVEYDITSPLPPVGIISISLDNAVELKWIPNQESDVAGYKIYVSDSYNGKYELIGSSIKTSFVDQGARNGITYYYAITAYDYSGNESDLSKDVAYDTPRPEGYNVILQDRFINPSKAGYDFSDYRVVYYDTDLTDLYVEFTQNGVPYFVVWEDTDIQDMGYTNDLDEITKSPVQGWSPTKDAHIILGHTYVIHTWDNHYAKVRVTDLLRSSVRFDWAYQLDKGNPELIAPPRLLKRNRTRTLGVN